MDNNTRNAMHFYGKGAEFFGIWIVNLLLSILTLGIYSAWAKVRTKRYFYGNTELAGDRFEYHAEPVQILKGRLIAVGCIILWVVVEQVNPALSIGFLLTFYAALPWLLRGNARFDAGMTSYRNVRFSFVGDLKGIYTATLGRGLLVMTAFAGLSALAFLIYKASVLAGAIAAVSVLFIMVFGQAWVIQGLWQYFARGYRYGNRQFRADLNMRPFVKCIGVSCLFIVFSVLLMSAIFVFGVSGATESAGTNIMQSDSFWTAFSIAYALTVLLSIGISVYFKVRIRNYVFSRLVMEQDEATSFEFESTLSVHRYLALIITNLLAQIVTLGLAHPWVKVRMACFLAENTAVYGDMNELKVLGQDPNVDTAITDELAQTFDVDLGLG